RSDAGMGGRLGNWQQVEPPGRRRLGLKDLSLGIAERELVPGDAAQVAHILHSQQPAQRGVIEVSHAEEVADAGKLGELAETDRE
ncbi:MAG: hypothetical protein ACREIC_26495, partial [Limisphaerales bacterium]